MSEYKSLDINNRIVWLDQARGFALLGILLANMLLFQYGMWEDLTFRPLNWYDRAAFEWTNIFAVHSFMPLFAFLFAFGMVIMKDHMNQKGNSKFRRVFFRRFLFLGIVGYLHGTYIWDGDILLSYSVIGLILLFLFLNRKPKTLLVWFIIFMALSTLLTYGGAPEAPDQEMKNFLEQSQQIMQYGSYQEIVDHRVNDLPPIFNDTGLLVVMLIIMPFFSFPPFLLGLYVAKKRWLHKPENHLKGIKKAFWLSLFLGFSLKSLTLIWDEPIVYMLSEGIGPLALTVFYITSIVLLAQSRAWKKMLKPFGALGRLSLSNYLMQSVIMTTIFYGYGLGLYGRIGVLAGICLAFACYAVQLIISVWWLKHFKMGLFEWLWRGVTHLKVPELRRKRRMLPEQSNQVKV
ncbi:MULTISPECIES: DUF418 domain-containing protein [Bacillus]|uniref:DUF418 domain-containing protein n=1 Tax=Bacillus capparidis TaxID=1840411 RepID=A0ABS4CWD3_9BACI|nr:MULTISPECIES: DUF418 domain-containing protein [Bacillus]MBP1081841.1 uncharacterized protein [Bacillus capparidis]MED1096490.1 DUF418 domain-containing protein [Bacillus capparidis]